MTRNVSLDARLSHQIEVVPAFYDIDPMEIVWHGHYVKYLELARSALLHKFDYDYPRMRACAHRASPGPSSTCG
ncbi:MAG: 4-hydroxybenzoyl-CoA thioesterase [Rhodoferax sp.]|nr:4-hydroxybenzoyl-CoA thioesterase [Rhodoferax sp.]